MTAGVQDLINAIASGDSQAIEQSFASEMATRISERLDDMRVEVAQNMFRTESVQVAEETEEEVEPLDEAEHEASTYHNANHVYTDSDSGGADDRKAYKQHMKKHFKVTTKFEDGGDYVEHHGSHKDIEAVQKHIEHLRKHRSISGHSGHELYNK